LFGYPGTGCRWQLKVSLAGFADAKMRGVKKFSIHGLAGENIDCGN
jgi:hypothetical protein